MVGVVQALLGLLRVWALAFGGLLFFVSCVFVSGELDTGFRWFLSQLSIGFWWALSQPIPTHF